MVKVRNKDGFPVLLGANLYVIAQRDKSTLVHTAKAMLCDAISASGKSELDMSMREYEDAFAAMLKSLGYTVEYEY